MTKARVSFDLDLDDYPQATTEEAVARLISDLLLAPGFAKALRVVPIIQTAKRFGVDVIDFDSRSNKTASSAMTAQRLSA